MTFYLVTLKKSIRIYFFICTCIPGLLSVIYKVLITSSRQYLIKRHINIITNQQICEKHHAFFVQREWKWKYWSKHKQTYIIGIRLIYINYLIANDYMYTHIEETERKVMRIKSLACINKPTFSSFSTGKGILVQNCWILSPTVNVSLITPWCFADTIQKKKNFTCSSSLIAHYYTHIN